MQRTMLLQGHLSTTTDIMGNELSSQSHRSLEAGGSDDYDSSAGHTFRTDEIRMSTGHNRRQLKKAGRWNQTDIDHKLDLQQISRQMNEMGIAPGSDEAKEIRQLANSADNLEYRGSKANRHEKGAMVTRMYQHIKCIALPGTGNLAGYNHEARSAKIAAQLAAKAETDGAREVYEAVATESARRYEEYKQQRYYTKEKQEAKAAAANSGA
jgi:hypothetical protein